jgi:hypothetical protein
MLKEDRDIERGAFGCAAIALFAVLALVLSIAVGVFFGAGFGLIAFAAFVVFALVCVVRAFVKVGK